MRSQNSPPSTPRPRSLSGEISPTLAPRRFPPRRSPPPPQRPGLDWRRIGAALSAATSLLGIAVSGALTLLKFRSDCRCVATLINSCQDFVNRIAPDLPKLFDCSTTFSSTYALVLGLPLTAYATALYTLTLALSLCAWRGGPSAPRALAWLFALALADVAASCVMFSISHWVLDAWCLFCFALYFLSASLVTSAALALGGQGATRPDEARKRAPLCPNLGLRLGLVGAILVSGQALPYWTRCDLPEGCLRPVPPPPRTRLVLGAEQPEVVLALVVDPSCAACKDEFAWLQHFIRDEAPQVRVQLYHFPREQGGCGLPEVRVPAPAIESVNRAACDLSFAIECVGERPGAAPDDALRALDISFRTLDASLPTAHLRAIAASFAADASQQQELLRCARARSGPIAERIAAHMRYAADRDVRGTPTMLIAPVVDDAPRWDLAQMFSGRSESRLVAAIQRARTWALRP